MSLITVQLKDELYWVADELICSCRSNFSLDGRFFPSFMRLLSARGTGPLRIDTAKRALFVLQNLELHVYMYSSLFHGIDCFHKL